MNSNNMEITQLEQEVIKNIVNSEFMDADGEEIINFPVWSFSVTDERNDLKGALGSLVKKGVCVCDTENNDETCYLTKTGYNWAKNNKLI